MEIIEKPWGKEEILQINSKYMVKRLTMHKGHRCSLQYHLEKIETIFVLKENLKFSLEMIKILLSQEFIKKDNLLLYFLEIYIVWKQLKIVFILKLLLQKLMML